MVKWTLVTGGAKRLGAEICQTLAASGHNIVVHYHNSHDDAINVQAACKKLGVEAELLQGDFSTQETTQKFIDAYLSQFTETEHLINNVGNYLIKSALNMPLKEWYDLFQTNLHAPFALIQALTPSLKKQQGSIVNIGIAGMNHLPADTYATAYSITKASLLMLTKSVAKELAPDHVRVNMVSPGYIDNAVDLPDPSRLPMGRPATTQEVARAVEFLINKDNAYITGQNIEVSGGVRL